MDKKGKCFKMKTSFFILKCENFNFQPKKDFTFVKIS